MFNTVDVKSQWKEVFRCGNLDNPSDIILILGSCRVVPYINYLHHANQFCGNRFKIYAIDPVNLQVDTAGNMLDTRGLLKALETDEHFLAILRSVTIFIHEGLSSFGILNTVKPEPGDTWEKPVWIYDFMAPRVDVNIGNFHDCFLMFKDFAQFDPTLRGELTEEQQSKVFQEGEAHLDRFCRICEVSSFPDFGIWFRENWLTTRLFHSFNHVSSAFTKKLFEMMNEKFLRLDLPPEFWASPEFQFDLYANASTPLCAYDLKWRPFTWYEPLAVF